MKKIIRRAVGTKKGGAALLAAMQIISLILISLLLPFGGPHQQSATVGTSEGADQAQTGTQTTARQPLTATDKRALRDSAVFANKLYEPVATQVLNLAATRAAEVQNSQNTQDSELPNEATLTTDREDYPPFSYVYFHGTGFQPGETVNMIVVELSRADPVSFQPWDVVADANGQFETGWCICSAQFSGAALQTTATGQSSGRIALANASASVATAKGANAGGPTSITSNTATASSGQTLLILVSAESDGSGAAPPVALVANTSGVNPLQAPATLIATSNASNIYMYAFRGTATGTAGTVTATFTTAVRDAAIRVIRLSDNDRANPIGVTGINSDTSGANSSPVWVVSGVLTPGSSMLLFGDLLNGTNTSPTWSTAFPTGFTQLDTFFVTDGNAGHRSAAYFGPSASLVTGSISGNAPWGTIAIEILPASAPRPTATDTPTATTTGASTTGPAGMPSATPNGSPETNQKAPETPESHSIAFASGSLIIPMDTDTAGNHASFNQDTGMWKAYGLLYKLLKSGVPVYWAIKENKVYNDIDFTVTSATDKRTGTVLNKVVQSVATVSKKAITSNVATLTISAHTISVSDTIVVRLSPADARFDGTRTVTAVTATTVSFASVNPNLGTTNTAGTVTYGPPTTGGWDYRGA